MRIHSLRIKFAISNVLPILLLMPLLSLYLFYSLETFFTQKMLQQLTYQANLLFDQVQQQPDLLLDEVAVQRFLTTVARHTDARVILLSPEGIVIGSTRQEDTAWIGKAYHDAVIDQALLGKRVQGIGPGFTTEVAYVAQPLQSNGVTAGVLRLSYEVDDLQLQLNQLRWLVIGGVAVTTLLGLGLAIGLATTITRPLRQLSEQTQAIAEGNYRARLTSQRQDEIGALAHSFNQMAARLNEAELVRTRQLAAIVHELARPLTGMRAAVETLLDGADADSEMRHALLSGMEEEVARLERQLRTLQSVPKRMLRPFRLRNTTVDLERVIRASVANFEPVAAQMGVILRTQLPAPLPPVQADEDRLIQVLTNLLDNALKFTPRSGQVTVQAGEDPDHVWITVADTGVGIGSDEQPYIFQQFYRGADSRAPEKLGMGLGLTICREIIRAHRGQITVDSTPGKGTRFTFTLPKK
ncbi:MAG: ATP-binding protein [Caldilineaceae bacterium]